MSDYEDGAEEVGYCKPPRKQQFQPGHVPHNKRPEPVTESINDIVRRTLRETRTVIVDGKRQTMSRLERAYRLDVERAVKGDIRAVKRMVKLLIKHPNLARSYRERFQIVIGGNDINA